jgi:hypothetical protein
VIFLISASQVARITGMNMQWSFIIQTLNPSMHWKPNQTKEKHIYSPNGSQLPETFVHYLFLSAGRPCLTNTLSTGCPSAPSSQPLIVFAIRTGSL